MQRRRQLGPLQSRLGVNSTVAVICFRELTAFNMDLQLPGDVLHEIASHLDDAEDVVAVGRVCKSWNECSKSESLWKRLYISNWDPWHESGDEKPSYRSASARIPRGLDREVNFSLITHLDSSSPIRVSFANRERYSKIAFDQASVATQVWTSQQISFAERAAGVVVKPPNVLLVSIDAANVLIRFFDMKNGRLVDQKVFACQFLNDFAFADLSYQKDALYVYQYTSRLLWILSLDSHEIRRVNIPQSDVPLRLAKVISFEYAIFRQDKGPKTKFTRLNSADSSQIALTELEFPPGQSHVSCTYQELENGTFVPLGISKTGGSAIGGLHGAVIRCFTAPSDSAVQLNSPQFVISKSFFLLGIKRNRSEIAVVLADLRKSRDTGRVQLVELTQNIGSEYASVGPVWAV
jgi:hypothetical protein